jgi:hypothetical protein
MGKQITHGDVATAQRVPDLEILEVLIDRLVEAEHATLDQLHDRGRGVSLSHRAEWVTVFAVIGIRFSRSANPNPASQITFPPRASARLRPGVPS